MSKHLLMPHLVTGSVITSLTLDLIKSKGLKTLLIDVDGTLLSSKQAFVDKHVIQWLDTLKKELTIHLISNNPSKIRISRIASQLGLPYTYKALKPRKFALLNVLNNMNCNYKEVAIIGDRIFTDILAGNRIGIYTILVKSFRNKEHSTNYSKILLIEKLLARLFGAII